MNLPKNLKINDNLFECDLALTDKQKSIGLQMYDHLPISKCLLFPFKKVAMVKFLMKKVQFNIDIAFCISGKIVKIIHNIQPGDQSVFECFCDCVIEFNGDTCKKLNIQENDTLTFS